MHMRLNWAVVAVLAGSLFTGCGPVEPLEGSAPENLEASSTSQPAAEDARYQQQGYCPALDELLCSCDPTGCPAGQAKLKQVYFCSNGYRYTTTGACSPDCEALVDAC